MCYTKNKINEKNIEVIGKKSTYAASEKYSKHQ